MFSKTQNKTKLERKKFSVVSLYAFDNSLNFCFIIVEYSIMRISKHGTLRSAKSSKFKSRGIVTKDKLKWCEVSLSAYYGITYAISLQFVLVL